MENTRICLSKQCKPEHIEETLSQCSQGSYSEKNHTLDDKVKLQLDSKKLRRHQDALGYLCLARKKNITHEAKYEPPVTPPLIKIKSLVTVRQHNKHKNMTPSDVENNKNLKRPCIAQVLRASPAPSDCSILHQSPRILDLRNPKSGILINKTKDNLSKLPFLNYNPRQLENCIGCPPYTIESFCDRLFVKVPDFECVDYPAEPSYDTGNSQIYAAKTFAIPCEQFLKKGTMVKCINASRAVKQEIYCPNTNRRLQSISTIYVAYATFFTIHPKTWNRKIMDRIVNEGEDHFKRCEKTRYINPDGDFDIMEHIVDKEITIRIRPVLEHKIHTPPNLLKVLTMVFQHYASIVFLHKDLYLLIVKKTENIFYIFDPNGRTFKCNREVEFGKAACITVQSVEGILHLLFHYSWCQYPQKYCCFNYRIYEIGLLNYDFPHKSYCGPYIRHVRKRYCVVNRFYAIINGTIGVEPPKYDGDENASIIIAYITLLYAYIDPPKHWAPKTINAIIHYGGQYYLSYMKALNLESVHVNSLPSNAVIGAYSGNIFITPYYECGFVEDIGNYRRSPLRRALLKYFRNNKQAILQIDNSNFAVWKDDKFFYVFDPMQRAKNGLALTSMKKNGGGVLQIHVNFDSMCRVLFMIAVKIINSGYFYLHGYYIDRINILSANKSLKPPTTGGNYYENLNIFYPNKAVAFRKHGANRHKAGGPIEINVPLECLSNLSLYPCQRADNETEFLEKEEMARQIRELGDAIERSYSMKSLHQSDKINDPDAEIVSELVLSDIFDIVDKFVIRAEEKMHHVPIKAKSVLLHTDLDVLSKLKAQIRRGEIISLPDEPSIMENVCPNFNHDQNSTNYETALTGNGILYGPIIKCGEKMDEIRSMLIRGITSAYGAIICARKYKISTWNSEIVESAMGIGSSIHKSFSSDSETIQALIQNRFPDIQIGCTMYRSTIRLLGIFSNIKMYEILDKCLKTYGKLILMFATFNCAVIKRRDQYYLFFGVPCDDFGYRSEIPTNANLINTRACVLEFITLKECVDRIIFDRIDKSFQSFILVSITPHHILDPCCKTNNQVNLAKERNIIIHEKEKQRIKQQYIKEKMDWIDEIAMKEKCRINCFNKQKKRKSKSKIKYDEPSNNKCCSDKQPCKKHKGKHVEETLPVHAEHATTKYTPGFIEGDDGIFRVRGKNYLQSRNVHDLNRVRACHFASIYAILQAIILPIHKWHPAIINGVIDKSKILSDRVECKLVRKRRFIRNLEVDEFVFDVCVTMLKKESLDPPHIIDNLRDILKTRKYFLLQCDNTTYGVYFDKFFYCFDPYLATEGNSSKCCKCCEKEEDLRGATWLLFPNQDAFLCYIGRMTKTKEWVTKNLLYYIDIKSFKENKSPTKHKDFMKHPFVALNMTEKEPQDMCCWNRIKSEKISWLSPGIPLWSRLNKGLSAMQNEQGNMNKAYEIEIPNELHSLYGTLHPNDELFKESRGKQYLAISVMACCIAHLFRVTEWNPYVIDTIVAHGDCYHYQSVKRIKKSNFEMELEYLNTTYKIKKYKININICKSAYGLLFCQTNSNDFNLSQALIYFFQNKYRYGILQLDHRCLTFGLANKGYFMFDCQSYGPPLFETDSGAAYCLLCDTLNRLINCIILTLNIRKSVEFVIHSVEVRIERLKC